MLLIETLKTCTHQLRPHSSKAYKYSLAHYPKPQVFDPNPKQVNVVTIKYNHHHIILSLIKKGRDMNLTLTREEKNVFKALTGQRHTLLCMIEK